MTETEGAKKLKPTVHEKKAIARDHTLQVPNKDELSKYIDTDIANYNTLPCQRKINT